MASPYPFVLYRFAGNHYEIGLQHGETFRKELRTIEQVVLKKVVKLDFLKNISLKTLGKKMFPHLPKEYVREMTGIARAGEISFETVYFLNMLPSLASCFLVTCFRKYLLPCLPQFTSCTMVALKERRAAGEGIIIGRNLDFGFASLFQDFIRFVIYQPKGRFAFFTITFPGFIGVLTAFSERRIFFAESSIDCSRMRMKAMPSVISFRQALERANSLDELRDQLIRTDRNSEYNVFIADREQAIHLELALRGSRALCLEDGHLTYAANHFQTRSLWRTSWRMLKKNPFLDFRQGVFEEHKAVTQPMPGIEGVRELMRKLGKGQENTSQTIYSLVLELDSLHGLIAYRGGVPATGQRYYPFSLSELFDEPDSGRT
jgi:hypothetical protein